MDKRPSLTGDAGVVFANEFASVRLRVVHRRHAQVLELHSSRGESSLVLDATALDLLAQTPIDVILSLSQEHGHGDVVARQPGKGLGPQPSTPTTPGSCAGQ